MEKSTKYALITGGTSGIGYELARLFAKSGHQLILVARDYEELEDVATELQDDYGVQVITLVKDLFDPEAPMEVYKEVLARDITIDVLVNNAGQGAYGKFIETDLGKELAVIQLNINATVILTKLFLNDMVRHGNGGKILNLASIASKVPGPYQAVYHGTKAFIHSFTEAVRSEMKDDSRVTLTSLLPGPTDTDFFHKAAMESSKVVQEGDLADPAKVAKDGYEALMAGKDMVISGFQTKVQAAMSAVMLDRKTADRIKNTQEPGDGRK